MLTYDEVIKCKDFAVSYKVFVVVQNRLNLNLNEMKDVSGKVEEGVFKEIIHKHSTAAITECNKVQQLIDITYEKVDMISFEKEILENSVYRLPNGTTIWFKVIGDYLATIQVCDFCNSTYMDEYHCVPLEDACKLAYNGYMKAMRK